LPDVQFLKEIGCLSERPETSSLLERGQPARCGQTVRAISFDGTLWAFPDGRMPEKWDDAITFIETEAEIR
jgi:hypothetical protein